MDSDLDKKEKQSPKTKMVKKTLKLLFWSIFRLGRWYIPNVPEIKAEELLDKLNSDQDLLLIDIRDESEIKKFGVIKNSQMFPYFDFPSYIDKIPKDTNNEIVTICPGGGASLIVAEILINEGFQNVKSLKGGIKGWYKKKYPLVKLESNVLSNTSLQSHEEKHPFLKDKFSKQDITFNIDLSINVRNVSCPGPVLESRKAIKKMQIGQILEILTTDLGSLRDIPAWAVNMKQEFLSYKEDEQGYRFLVRKLQ